MRLGGCFPPVKKILATCLSLMGFMYKFVVSAWYRVYQHV